MVRSRASFFGREQIDCKAKILIFVFRKEIPPLPSLRRDEPRGFEQSGERTACRRARGLLRAGDRALAITNFWS
jgi:hypothetical protein